MDDFERSIRMSVANIITTWAKRNGVDVSTNLAALSELTVDIAAVIVPAVNKAIIPEYLFSLEEGMRIFHYTMWLADTNNSLPYEEWKAKYGDTVPESEEEQKFLGTIKMLTFLARLPSTDENVAALNQDLEQLPNNPGVGLNHLLRVQGFAG